MGIIKYTVLKSDTLGNVDVWIIFKVSEQVLI